jgi:hypothetical protein
MKIVSIMLLLAVITPAVAQTPATQQAPSSAPAYQPKFAGDKAHSNAEAGALGYMRTVVSAQKAYKAKHGKYAVSLPALVGSGSFTRRMQLTDRGDYTVAFHSKPEGYSLTLTPKQFAPEHRAFYVDETGVFRAEDDKPTTQSSPVLK